MSDENKTEAASEDVLALVREALKRPGVLEFVVGQIGEFDRVNEIFESESLATERWQRAAASNDWRNARSLDESADGLRRHAEFLVVRDDGRDHDPEWWRSRKGREVLKAKVDTLKAAAAMTKQASELRAAACDLLVARDERFAVDPAGTVGAKEAEAAEEDPKKAKLRKARERAKGNGK